jgi:hypothetical protein
MSCASLNTQGGTAAAGLTETLLQRTGMAIIIDEVSHQSPWSSHKKKKQAGVLGYFFNKMKFQLAPLVVGLILGPNIEKHFREALFLSQGDRWIYVESPIAVAIWLLVAAILIAGFIARRRAAFAEAMAQDSSEGPKSSAPALLAPAKPWRRWVPAIHVLSERQYMYARREESGRCTRSFCDVRLCLSGGHPNQSILVSS